MGHRYEKRKIIMIAAAFTFMALVILAVTGIIASAAGGNDISYRLGSTGDITYKENDNKVYYTRKHYSSGSSIRYYTAKFVISLNEVSAYDDLSSLNSSGSDYSMELTVALNGSSIKEKDADKTKSFYWYDSDEADDDGYITTTYVIDGSILLEFLENAAAQGRRGSLYIHHVFSITGGSADDTWHKNNKVVNDVPYYRYGDLFKLTWSNTEATRTSQEACMNIPVPFKTFCEVYTAYYNEYGRVVRRERGTLAGNAYWIKTVPYIINGTDGKKYASLEPGTRKDVKGNIMRVYYVYNTDPKNKRSFPLWNPEKDRQSADGNTIKYTDASGSHLVRGGYLKKTDSIYSLGIGQENIYDVILYVPVTNADNELNPGPTSGPEVTPLAIVTPDPDVTPFPDVTPVPFITPDPFITDTGDPEYAESELTVKYFFYDRLTGDTDCIKLENIINTDSLTGKYAFDNTYTVKLSDTIYKNGKLYEPVSLDGILYGDNASVLASGSMGFTDTFNMQDDKIYGMSSGSLRKEEGYYVDFKTGDSGGFCTVYIMCREVRSEDSLLIRYIDEESGDIVSEQLVSQFFDGKKLYWHGINGKLSWAYKVPLTDIVTPDGVSLTPLFKEEGAYEVICGKCAPYEAVHEHFGGFGNDVTWYCTTCGKVKRITYFMDSPYSADAETRVYDNNSTSDAYHSYRLFHTGSGMTVKAGYVYGSFITDNSLITGRTYESCSDCEYDFDESSDMLWIAVPDDPDSGNLAFTYEPEKEVPFSAGVIYIPCTLEEARKPVHIHITDENLKYVQYHYAQKDLPQAVVGNDESSVISLTIDEYGDDVLVEFELDVLTLNGIRIKAGTKHIPYPAYRVPDDTEEGIYSVKAEVFDRGGNIIYTDEAFLEVTGSLYGLTLYNISSDSYEWKGVFEGQYTGYGVETLPLLDGDSPKVKNAGMLKSGYIWSFYLKTSGSRMQHELSGIRIIPEFYHISADGTKKQVDIYYQGAGGKDGENILKEGKTLIAERGVKSIQPEDEGTGSSEIESTDSSICIWSFEYSLPDTWYCVDTGFDLDGYLDIYDGCTFDEPFWEKEGYLAVCFRIEAYAEDGTVIMSYSNLKENVEAGMCDMWAAEDYQTEKTDVYGTEFLLDEGDVILVRLPASTIKKGSGVPDPPTNSKEDNMIKPGGLPYLSLPM